MSFSQTKPKSRTRRNKEVDYLGVQPLLERTKRGARVKAEEAKLELIKKLAEEKIMKDFDKKQKAEKKQYKIKMEAEINDLADELLHSKMTVDVDDLLSGMSMKETSQPIVYRNPFTDFRIKRSLSRKKRSKKTKSKKSKVTPKRTRKSYRKSKVRRTKYRLSRRKYKSRR
jgi:hypothetical protein